MSRAGPGETADKIFQQMDKMLEENGKEMERLRKEYSQKCLHDAEAICLYTGEESESQV